MVGNPFLDLEIPPATIDPGPVKGFLCYLGLHAWKAATRWWFIEGWFFPRIRALRCSKCEELCVEERVKLFHLFSYSIRVY